MLELLKQTYGDDLSLTFRHFPLTSIHNLATLSSVATEAAGLQDKFWEYHDLIFAKQGEWAQLGQEDATAKFVDYADELGLDTTQFESDLSNQDLIDKVNASEQEAINAALTGTPSIIVNGYMFPTQQLPMSPEGIDFFLDIVRLVENQYDAPEQVLDPAKSYEAVVNTEKGEIVFDLFTDTAPINSNSIAFLAEQGFYDNSSFHRVLDGFMAQGGDASSTGMGWPGYRCDDEITTERTFAGPGVVAMANSGPNTNGSQFFITFGDTSHLDGGYTIVGQVTEGQDVVNALTLRNPEQQPDFKGDLIYNIEIREK